MSNYQKLNMFPVCTEENSLIEEGLTIMSVGSEKKKVKIYQLISNMKVITI